MSPKVQERLAKCATLPTVPAVALKILGLCQRDDLDVHEIASTIGLDPALAAKLIKTVNSPLFSLRREVTTISNAVTVLGVNAVKTLSLSFSLVQGLKSADEPYLRNFWQRSLLSAIVAKQVCKGSNIQREEAFLVGLLQDIGILALARAFGEEYISTLHEAALDHDRLIRLEHLVHGADHAEVGGWLLSRWGFPEQLGIAIAASHNPRNIASNPPASALAAQISLAGRFADLWAGNREAAPVSLANEIETSWPSGSVDISAVNNYLIENAPQVAKMFDLTLRSDEMVEVLNQAQEALLALSVRTSEQVRRAKETIARHERSAAALLAESQSDALTGVANRGYTDSYLQQVFSDPCIGVIYVDVDHFKSVNDRFGHPAGDAILQSVAARLKGAIRNADFLGRYGGEEFLLILRTHNLDELANVAERIRKSMQETPHDLGKGSIEVTVSLGCARLHPERHKSPRDLVADADAALYLAKNAGRNRFEIAAAA